MSGKRLVELCSGCLTRAGSTPSGFVESLSRELQERRPDLEWKVTLVSCRRFCPPERLALVVDGQLGMSADQTLDKLVEDLIKRP